MIIQPIAHMPSTKIIKTEKNQRNNGGIFYKFFLEDSQDNFMVQSLYRVGDIINNKEIIDINAKQLKD